MQKTNYYEAIKEQIINNEITKGVKDYSKNKSDLITCYNVGKLLSEAGKCYGERIVKEYSFKLTNELGKKYNETNLKRMRQFYWKVVKGATVWHQLSWSHYRLLITLETIEEINYYSKVAVDNLYSVRKLEDKIKSNEYKRIPEESKLKLITNNRINIKDLVPNPILIRNKNNIEIVTEKILQKLILEDIELFMKELGNSFSFIGSEYKIKIGTNFNYIDLLLFNYEYNCFVVVELKVTELKKEHIGQIQVYMNYIDENLRKFNQDKTIGIIICKQDNKYVIKYCSDDRIIAREYELV
ncbi:MAG: DUF1016 domain-containing protein [Firmicutes bacterium]|nr:DUF1016 domain-containing protein [Bacillota bacterium]